MVLPFAVTALLRAKRVSVVVPLLIFISAALVSCRLAGGTPAASSSPDENPVSPHLTSSPLGEAIGAVVIRSKVTGVEASSRRECAGLDTDFLTEWCEKLLGDPAALPEPTKADLGLTTDTYAWMARKLATDPNSFCTDDKILTWFEMTPRGLGGRTADEVCSSYVDRVLSQGSFEVSDPNTGVTVSVELEQ